MKRPWTMPEWMEPYRDFINNTGGNPIEELVNDNHTHIGNNPIRAALIVAVTSQIHLLNRLHAEGLLRGPCEICREPLFQCDCEPVWAKHSQQSGGAA